MAPSDQTPSPGLLRLRPADVVRICGLNAAATGLDLVANHSVTAGRRDGSRLFATVNAESPYDVWVEVPTEVDSTHWACTCAHSGPLACAHVAATLSAWIAHPGDFIGKTAEARPATAQDDARELLHSPGGSEAHQPAASVYSASPAEATTLAVALSRMNAGDIAVIARRVLGEDVSEDDTSVRQHILAALSDPPHLQALLHRLDDSAQMLLSLLVLGGGATTVSDLEGLSTRLGSALSAVQSDVAVLERHALLLPMLPASTPSQHGPGSTWRHVAGWRVPDEVQHALTITLPLDALPTMPGSRFPLPPREASGTPLHVERTTPRPLLLALALLANAPPPLGLTRVAATSGGAATPTGHGSGLLAPGELAPERLRELARSAGLDMSATRLARRLLRHAREHQAGPLISDIARMPVAERPVVLRTAFRRWLRSESAADLLDLDPARVHVRYATAHPAFRPAAIGKEVSDARRFVARVVSHARPDTWYALDQLVALIWQLRPGLLRGQQQAWATPAWWLESTREQRALQPQVHEDWMAAEGEFIHSLLAHTFALWGAVDVAARDDGTATAFRLTPFGAFLLSRDNNQADSSLVALCDADWGPPVLPLREGALAVQPLAAEATVLDALALWATPSAVSGRRLVYSLSADRACAAFDRGLAPDTLPAILRPLHHRAAESVLAQLNLWHTGWGRSHFDAGFTLLEASDEAALIEALNAAPDIAARCRRIGPALALLLPKDAAILTHVLARRGYAV